MVIAGVLLSTHLAAATMLADWGTTLDLRYHPELQESNRILGAHPSRRAINLYFLTKIGLTYYFDNNAWNCTQIGLTLYAVDNNLALGLKVRF